VDADRGRLLSYQPPRKQEQARHRQAAAASKERDEACHRRVQRKETASARRLRTRLSRASPPSEIQDPSRERAAGTSHTQDAANEQDDDGRRPGPPPAAARGAPSAHSRESRHIRSARTNKFGTSTRSRHRPVFRRTFPGSSRSSSQRAPRCPSITLDLACVKILRKRVAESGSLRSTIRDLPIVFRVRESGYQKDRRFRWNFGCDRGGADGM
jgi:hypothetical protein